MALWRDQMKPSPSTLGDMPTPARNDAALPIEPRFEAAASEPVTRVPAAAIARTHTKSESLIAPDIAIEGKIEGAGHVRVAGRFKGDVNVQGDLSIEPHATVTGSVRADKVVIAGELIGNIDAASHVDLAQSGALTGDLKAGTLTVAAGSRMRGHAEFGWEDLKNATQSEAITRKTANGHGPVS
ncbi:MAG: polymer-forming cytoskeletal protein [Rudaea sp.]